jgi:hypothetical protein
MPEQPLLTPAEASVWLLNHFGVRRTAGTLAKLRVVGGGPPYRKLSRSVLYAPGDLSAWAEASLQITRRTTSDLGRFG